MRGVMLFAAGLFAGLALQVMTAQNANRGVVMMNHVGVSVPNIAEAVTYYTQKMGYREAFRVNDDKGQPRLVYMQISKNTFLNSTRSRRIVPQALATMASMSTMLNRLSRCSASAVSR